MDLATMQVKFVTRLAGSESDWPEPSINEYLNAAYQYSLAAEIPGSLTDGEWSMTTEDGTAEYDYDDEVYEVKGNGRHSTGAIQTYFRKDAFDSDYANPSAGDKPQAVLLYARTAKFAPVPGDEHVITFPARLFPSILTSTGLVNGNHAMAVVCESVRAYAFDFGDDEMAARNATDLSGYLSKIKSQSLARPRERGARLSF